MLASPPPGYNTAAMNYQHTPFSEVPGQQGGTSQGYFNPFVSSYALPSSFHVPSSIDVPNQYYGQQQSSLGPQNAQMLSLLRGR